MTSLHNEEAKVNLVNAAKEDTRGVEAELGEKAKRMSKRERENWLTKQFRLDQSPFLKAPNDLRAAIDVLMEFWDTFSHDGSYGKTHLLKHRIITEDVQPIKCRYRPINPALELSLIHI